MNINEIFPSKYLKASDLQGRDVQVTISHYAMEKLGDETKLVIYFQGKEKGLVTNRTNADRIANMYGPDTDAWIGKEIMLYADMVNFQGRAMSATRVRPPQKRNGHGIHAPAKAAPVQHEPPPHNGDDDMDDSIPF